MMKLSLSPDLSLSLLLIFRLFSHHPLSILSSLAAWAIFIIHEFIRYGVFGIALHYIIASITTSNNQSADNHLSFLIFWSLYDVDNWMCKNML